MLILAPQHSLHDAARGACYPTQRQESLRLPIVRQAGRPLAAGIRRLALRRSPDRYRPLPLGRHAGSAVPVWAEE
jgi:hypothetical protein